MAPLPLLKCIALALTFLRSHVPRLYIYTFTSAISTSLYGYSGHPDTFAPENGSNHREIGLDRGCRATKRIVSMYAQRGHS